jgi:autotransporter-associated beta strand protein
LTKLGTGNVTLSGANTYSGGTTVSAGTLSVNGSIASSAVTVSNGGTLGGTGTVGATTIVSGGTLAPGNSIGTIAVNGNLTFNAGSHYNIEVSPSAADRTNVSGTATLAGSVNASYAPGSYVAKRYTILNASAGVNGTFAALVNTGLPSTVSASLSYDAQNAYLDLALNFAPPGGALNGNQQAASTALQNYFNSNGGIPGAFAALSANDLSQTAGEAGTGSLQSGFYETSQFINSVLDNALNGGSAPDPGGTGELGYAEAPQLPPKAQNAYAAVTPRDRRADFAKRWSVWASGYGGTSTTSGDNAAGSNRTTSNVYGAVAGSTYRLAPATWLGFALGGAGSSFSIANGFGSGKADMFNAALYARHVSGPLYLAAAFGYTWQDASTDRTVTAAGTDVLHASFHPQALTGRVEGGWRYVTAMGAMTPYAALQNTSFFLPAYGETATSGANTYALNYASHTVTATRSELGARFDKIFSVTGGIFTLNAKAAWAHDWNTDRTATATFQQLPGATFAVNGAQPAADAALVEFGGEMAWRNGWAVLAKVNGEFSSNTTTAAGRAAIRYTW